MVKAPPFGKLSCSGWILLFHFAVISITATFKPICFGSIPTLRSTTAGNVISRQSWAGGRLRADSILAPRLFNYDLSLHLRGGESSNVAGGNETAKPISLNQRLRDAVREFNRTLAEDLICEGANVNSVERGTHATVLITASFQNDVEMVKTLIRHGANPNLSDEMIMAPLHYAAAWGYDEMVDLLMMAGADPTQINLERLTPQNLAENRGHNRTVDLLQRWIDAR